MDLGDFQQILKFLKDFEKKNSIEEMNLKEKLKKLRLEKNEHTNGSKMIIKNEKLAFLRNLNLTDKEFTKEIIPECLKRKQMPLRAFAFSYIEFLKIINTSENRRSIEKFDLSTMAVIFSHTYQDKSINDFIEKVYADPGQYNRDEKTKFAIILLFIFFYLKNTGRGTEKIRKKVIKFSEFFQNSEIDFPFHITGDRAIDSIVLKVYPATNEKDLGILLNYFKTQGNFYDFQEKINRNLSKFNPFTFLKTTFLYKSAIHDHVNQSQLIKVILPYYEKIAIKESNIPQILKFISLLIKYFPECYSTLTTIPYLVKKSFPYEVKSYNNFNQYKIAISMKKDNFTDLKIILSYIMIMIENISIIKKSKVFEVINLAVYFGSEISKEFRKKFLRDLIRMYFSIFKFFVVTARELKRILHSRKLSKMNSEDSNPDINYDLNCKIEIGNLSSELNCNLSGELNIKGEKSTDLNDQKLDNKYDSNELDNGKVNDELDNSDLSNKNLYIEMKEYIDEIIRNGNFSGFFGKFILFSQNYNSKKKKKKNGSDSNELMELIKIIRLYESILLEMNIEIIFIKNRGLEIIKTD